MENIQNNKIHSFTDLVTWQQGHKLVLEIYSTTKHWPKEEQFGLISQIRRAAVSVTSNVAEGFSRQTAKDKIHFYSMSLGSVSETQNQLYIAKDLAYITEQVFNKITEQVVATSKLINGLIKSLKHSISNA